MPDVARWGGIDAKAESYNSYSPFSYLLNNPLSNVDPTGMAVESVVGGFKYAGNEAPAILDIVQQTQTKRKVYLALVEDDNLLNSTSRRSWRQDV